jgi:hypothetical protein
MRKVPLAALLALAVPAVALAEDGAPSSTDLAQAACKSEKAQIGTKTCKAERAADPAAFTTKYGTNSNGRNAFGRCVSKTAKAS